MPLRHMMKAETSWYVSVIGSNPFVQQLRGCKYSSRAYVCCESPGVLYHLVNIFLVGYV